MGLRERKAQRTRGRILEVALARFAENGYDATTMEEIAEAAEIHPATLYRYFPGKDLIVLAEFATYAERVADTFEAQGEDVGLTRALGAAIEAGLAEEDPAHQAHRDAIRSIIDQSPTARARVWDLQDEQRRRIGAGIAARLGRPEDDLAVVLAARTAVMVVETAADVTRAGDGTVSGREVAARLVGLLAEGAVPLPLLDLEAAPAASPRAP